MMPRTMAEKQTLNPAPVQRSAASVEPAQKVRLKVVSQAFRYADYGSASSLARTLRLNVKPIQFLVNTWCDPSLKDKEVEIGIEIRDRNTGEPLFETFWVTMLLYEQQQSSFILRELPEEWADIQPGQMYTYHASALVNETDDFAERSTRVFTR